VGFRAWKKPFLRPDESRRDEILDSTMYPKKAVESRRDGILHSVYSTTFHVDRSTICRPCGTLLTFVGLFYTSSETHGYRLFEDGTNRIVASCARRGKRILPPQDTHLIYKKAAITLLRYWHRPFPRWPIQNNPGRYEPRHGNSLPGKRCTGNSYHPRCRGTDGNGQRTQRPADSL